MSLTSNSCSLTSNCHSPTAQRLVFLWWACRPSQSKPSHPPLLHPHPAQLMTQPTTRQRQRPGTPVPSHHTQASQWPPVSKKVVPLASLRDSPSPVALNRASRLVKDETSLLPAFSCSSHSIPQLCSLLVLPYGPSCFPWAFQPAWLLALP